MSWGVAHYFDCFPPIASILTYQYMGAVMASEHDMVVLRQCSEETHALLCVSYPLIYISVEISRCASMVTTACENFLSRSRCRDHRVHHALERPSHQAPRQSTAFPDLSTVIGNYISRQSSAGPPADEYATMLRKGVEVTKYGRTGKPHVTTVALTSDSTALQYQRKNNEFAFIPIRCVEPRRF